MQHKFLLLWDRTGDYHRARIAALKRFVGDDAVISADLFSNDSMYLWENTVSQSHYCLTDNGGRSAWVAFKHFRSLVKDQHISVVCIPGYQQKVYLLFLLWARLNGLKVILFAESWYPSNRLLEFAKSFFLRFTVNLFFVSGNRAKNHFHSRLRIPLSKIKIGYSVVDNEHFKGNDILPSNDKPILLCVARYAPEKNLSLLIRAFLSSELSNKWQLIIVGEGPLKQELQEMANDSVILTGWKKYGDLPQLYHSASCFILPSSFEPWGLVVNEAMAAGLPIIISEECGCCPELLEKNGWVFKSDDEAKLCQILNDLAQLTNEQRVKMGLVSSQIIQKYSCETWAQTVAQAFNK